MKTIPKFIVAILAAAVMIVFAVTSCTKTGPVSTESSKESDTSPEQTSEAAVTVPIIGSSANRELSSDD